MVDDSIVRGTTCANIIKMLKKAGATEVHVRISSPPFYILVILERMYRPMISLCTFSYDGGNPRDDRC